MLVDFALAIFIALLVVTSWVVSDPLNLAVSIYMAIVLVLGWIVVDRS
jgi:hypothetical protein